MLLADTNHAACAIIPVWLRPHRSQGYFRPGHNGALQPSVVSAEDLLSVDDVLNCETTAR